MQNQVLKMAKGDTWRRIKFVTCDKVLEKLTKELLQQLNLDGHFLKGDESRTERLEIEVCFSYLQVLFLYLVMSTHRLVAFVFSCV